jgi:hypothetical protein
MTVASRAHISAAGITARTAFSNDDGDDGSDVRYGPSPAAHRPKPKRRSISTK